ncbi:hypothetical protein H4696_008602 [Amycolatopsis lexingtonensis]|uniref:Uncharacterized protein n=1 Tax=Amycolatopsis lexingtonensis TaxID=218822 RepID=A0ABR9IEV5_9PSEU|nr:hypothetical protein [Amycolatopsis lexingtonensis]MBE1501502.1 hypothetical protein [Amycolatopsis lexingtonensis]
MDDIVHFMGLPYDGSRPPSSAGDVARLAEALQDNGFAVSEPLPPSGGPGDGDNPALEVWQQGFGAEVSLEKDWTVQVLISVEYIDVVRDAVAGRRGIELLARLIGTLAELADPYLGFISTDAGDDLSFLVEDRPVEITEPLALAYFGRRYLDDWGTTPDFAGGAEYTAQLSGGVLVIPALEGLG